MNISDQSSKNQPVDHTSAIDGASKSQVANHTEKEFNESSKSQPVDYTTLIDDSSKSQSVSQKSAFDEAPKSQHVDHTSALNEASKIQLVYQKSAFDESPKSQPVDYKSVIDDSSKSQSGNHKSASDESSKIQLIDHTSAFDESPKSQPVDHKSALNKVSKIQPVDHTSAFDESPKIQPVDHTSAFDETSKRLSVNDTIGVSFEPSKRNVDHAKRASDQRFENRPEETITRAKTSSRSACAQVLATLIENTLLIDIGIELAMPTIVLGALHRHPTEKLCMDDDQASWFGSLSHLAHLIGSLTSGFLQEQFGRKGSMLLVNFPILAAFLTLHFADSILALYAVSATLGLCCGVVEAPLHSYIGEIGEPRMRGTLSTLMNSAVGVGSILTFSIAAVVDWRTAALIISSVPIITFICMTQIPESPTWLIKKHRLDDAMKSLCWLRGWVKPEDVKEEFESLVEYTKQSNKRSGTESQEITQLNANGIADRKDGFVKTKYREFADRKVLLPIRMVFIIFAFSYVTITLPLKPYLVRIITEFGIPMKTMLIMDISTSASFTGTIMNMVFLRNFGKRKLALFAHAVATASIILLGLYCSFLRGSNWPSDWNLDWLPSLVWIPMILIVANDFCGGFCVGLLPWQLVCEIFPVMGRGFAGGVSAAWAYSLAFIMTKSYLYLEAWLQLSGVLYLLGGTAIIGWFYHYFYLPETEGKTLEQIESYFTNNHDRKEKFSLGKPQRHDGGVEVCGLESSSSESKHPEV